MNIKILGNGGFYNEGLPYNAMAIDGHVLVETPPDILQSLMQQGMSPAQVDTVFISHIHGDHCFGFPFFFLTGCTGAKPTLTTTGALGLSS